MHINSVQNYNYQNKIYENRSFKSIKISPNLCRSEVFDTIESSGIEFITEKLRTLAKEKFNLREIVRLKNSTIQKEKILNNLFSMLGEEEVNDLTVRIKPFFCRYNPTVSYCYHNYYDGGIDFKINLPQQEDEITIDTVGWIRGLQYSGYGNKTFTEIFAIDNKKNEPSKYHQQPGNNCDYIELPTKLYDNGKTMLRGLFFAIPQKERIQNNISKAFNEIVNKIIQNEEAAFESFRKDDALNALNTLIQTMDNKSTVGGATNTSVADKLPTSVICTFDDINQYLLKHITEIDNGKIFNKPVTKDNESLLLALTHVIPDKENFEIYRDLVNNMHKMPLIDYNQIDGIGIPAIAHVLNSENKLLFAAFCNCKDLKYEPSLEYEFNRIKDSDFKDLVLKSRIFENGQNTKYKTIFGQPNPLYKGANQLSGGIIVDNGF